MLLSGAAERWRLGVEGVYIFSVLVRLDAFQEVDNTRNRRSSKNEDIALGV